MRNATAWVVGLSLATVGMVAVSSFPRQKALGGAAPHDAVSAAILPASEDTVRRLKAKAAVTHRLLNGDLTLLEAAAWFQFLDATLPPPAFPGLPGEERMSETERFCRQAARWADGAAADMPPNRIEAVRRRLAAELDAALRQTEKKPPDPPAEDSEPPRRQEDK